jgi:hypothetical protein
LPVGIGRLYQRTYQSFPIPGADHFLTVLRYTGNQIRDQAGLSPDVPRSDYIRYARRRRHLPGSRSRTKKSGSCPREIDTTPTKEVNQETPQGILKDGQL